MKPTTPMPHMTLFDLVYLKQSGVFIDVDAFANAFDYENKHRDFSSCHGCGAVTWEQHKLDCPRSSILTLPDWYAEVRRHSINSGMDNSAEEI
jgi:hypothetical protein